MIGDWLIGSFFSKYLREQHGDEGVHELRDEQQGEKDKNGLHKSVFDRQEYPGMTFRMSRNIIPGYNRGSLKCPVLAGFTGL
ncbi:MAG: hypothetical protein OHK0019_33100 [Saprospiraceae bacterium]